MKVMVADIYDAYIVNPRQTKFPKRFRGYKIIWNMRDVLIDLWEGNVTHIAIPEDGTPGYDFPEFVDTLIKAGQIEKKPIYHYYKLERKY